ncbi:MAG: hypothetical protein AMXMBFR66_06390 [Pseudomonadota bacterium]|nr:hypothetical protein [Rubrivivax sp.]NLZ42243.1 hypothetical protein [Comamonadaceae bacterium]
MPHALCLRRPRAGRSLARPASAALALATALAAPGAACAQDAPPTRLASAQAAYEIGHYREAFDLYVALADEGHCEAARMARAMLRYGRVLYGIAFEVGSERAARWRAPTACVAVAAATRTP